MRKIYFSTVEKKLEVRVSKYFSFIEKIRKDEAYLEQRPSKMERLSEQVRFKQRQSQRKTAQAHQEAKNIIKAVQDLVLIISISLLSKINSRKAPTRVQWIC
jgi:hypothetical protein